LRIAERGRGRSSRNLFSNQPSLAPVKMMPIFHRQTAL